jgi:hypothetical protein
MVDCCPVGSAAGRHAVPNPIVPQELREVQVAASALGLEVTTLEIRRAQDIMPSFEALKNRAEALYLASEGLVDANRLRVNVLALGGAAADDVVDSGARGA